MTTPLPSQRHLFAIDGRVAYLDTAAFSPIPLCVEEAGTRAFASKSRPWLRDRHAAQSLVEDARALAGRLVGATAEDIAIVGSVSYAISTAALNFDAAPGERVLILEGEHTSQNLSWIRFAQEHGAVIDAVARPADGDWTQAVLERIARPGAPRIAVAALSPLMWNDGALIDLHRLCAALRAHGAATMIDATQAVGVLDVNALALDADVIAFPAYKWLLGPYSLAFMYVAPRHQGGKPLEENGFNRQLADPGQSAGAEHAPYLPGARRFDRGERDTFVGIPSVVEALRLLDGWGQGAIEARARLLMDELTGALAAAGLDLPHRALQAPHILGLRGLPADAAQQCRALGIYVSQRNDVLRISPHVFNDEADMRRCAAALISLHRTSRAAS